MKKNTFYITLERCCTIPAYLCFLINMIACHIYHILTHVCSVFICFFRNIFSLRMCQYVRKGFLICIPFRNLEHVQYIICKGIYTRELVRAYNAHLTVIGLTTCTFHGDHGNSYSKKSNDYYYCNTHFTRKL